MGGATSPSPILRAPLSEDSRDVADARPSSRSPLGETAPSDATRLIRAGDSECKVPSPVSDQRDKTWNRVNRPYFFV